MTAGKLCLLIGVHLVGFLIPGAVLVALWQTAVRPMRSGLSWRAVPGQEGLSFEAPRNPLTELLKILLFSGVIAYGSFFAYVVSPLFGRMYSLGIYGVALGVVVVRRDVRKYVRTVMMHRDVVTPLLLALCLGFLYTGSTLLYGGEVHVSLVANSRYRDPLPPDNILPRLVAERVVDGIRGEPFLADWLSSDRPPLQAAVETMVSPFIPKGSRELNYQALATMLQLLVIPAGWILLRRLRIGFVTTLGVVSVVALSGTLALNGTYVWPKLLCAAYSLLAVAALVPSTSSDSGDAPAHNSVGLSACSWRRHLPTGLLAGAGFGLSFAAHGGALFVVLPIICVLTVTWTVSLLALTSTRSDADGKGNGRPSGIVVGALGAVSVGALLVAPWLGYQRIVAPPGNRLLKWHLAGVVDIDQRSFGQAMIDRYTTPPLREIVANKTSNIRELFNPARFVADIMPLWGSDDSIDRVRQREFGHLGNSTSVSAVGIGLGLAGLLVKRRCSRELTVGLIGLGSGVLATLVWSVAMYGPKATIPHQGSLAVPIVLIASAALLAASAHRWALGVFVVLSAYKVTRVWILAGPLSPERQRSSAALGTLLIGAAAFVVVLFGSIRHDTTTNHNENTNPESFTPVDRDLLLAVD